MKSFDKLRTRKLVLIDSNAIIHRAYHALPKTMSTRKGEQTNAVYGFATTLIKVLEDLKPDYVAASFDVSKATFRTEKYAAYKATRVKADQELYDQIPRVHELLSAFNIPIYEKEGFEADDCIGTIVKNCHEHHSCHSREGGNLESGSQIQACLPAGRSGMTNCEDLSIYIVTGDKDIYQLIDGNIFVYSLRKGLSQMAVVDRKVIKEEYGLDPEDFIDLKALAGDASDNIPGVPGIGPKTATELLQKYDTLKNLYEKIEKKEELDIKPRILQLLIEYKEQAFLSQDLATIHKDVPIKFDLIEAEWGEYDREKVKDLFEELGFHSLLRRFGTDAASTIGGAGAPASAESGSRGKTERAKEQAKKDEQLKLL